MVAVPVLVPVTVMIVALVVPLKVTALPTALHTPLPVSVSVSELPLHIAPAPIIPVGGGSTFIVWLTLQPAPML